MTGADPRDVGSQLRLLAWLSPAFPVGAFSYSHGLERAVHDRLVADGAGLAGWFEALLTQGSGWNDAVLLAEGWRRAAAGQGAAEVAELAEALAGSAERHLEAMLQGAAFLDAASAWPHPLVQETPPGCPYCVAVGWTAGAHGVALEAVLAAFLHAFASSQTQAAIRLGIIGQSEAVAILAALEPVILATAARAARSTPDDLGSATLLAEIAAMNHETQYSRLFRS